MNYANCQICYKKSSALFKLKKADFPNNYSDIQSEFILVCEICKNCLVQSKESIDNILSSYQEEKKLIIGGPGTGKTYLFEEIIKNLPRKSNILVVTFIKNLADDLKKRLENITDREVDVKTLHGFCKGFFLNNIDQFEYFPDLPKLIENDAILLEEEFKEIDFIREFANLNIGKEVKFYLSRSEYYNSISHNDTVYRVYSSLHKNNEMIPQFSQVIIDEYQDFNCLELKLIELLAQKNKIIIAGDDDQALYRFKFAKPEFIRNLYYEDETYKNRNLPYCRRCTSVLVAATNAFIARAKSEGLLEKRIKKDFLCYWPTKYIDSNKYPSILLGKCSTDKVVSKFVKEKIISIVKKENIQPSEKEEPEFLVLGPPRISHYLKETYEELTSELDGLNKGVFEIEYKKDIKKLTKTEGYKLIKKDFKSNLGWRIVLFKNPIDSSKEKDKEIIHKSLKGVPLINLLPDDYIKKHIENVEKMLPEADDDSDESTHKKIKIKLTTYLRAKGLSANHVFVLGMENRVLPSNPSKISTDEICQFIVLLTRARKSLSFPVSRRFINKYNPSVYNPSPFLDMIPKEFFNIKDKITAADFKK